MSVPLPHNGWTPRIYQEKLWDYLDDGGLRAYMVAHRRWGKDDVCLHWTACAAMRRVGNYLHMLPSSEQARKAIWNAINPHTGKKRVDEAFPQEIRKRTVDHEMRIEFVNGSMWQVVGSDNYDNLVGGAPVGIVFSEWALADPQAWPYMQPILEENGGWALFITTPRGRNHAADFYEMARANDEWYCEKQGADDTGVFSQQQLDNIKRELVNIFGHSEGMAKYKQEYFVSFDAALPGAYWGDEMNEAEDDGRITNVPYDPAYPVIVSFDFGRGNSNSTSMIFFQVVGLEPRIIDYHEDSNGDIPTHCNLLRSKPYNYSHLILPHDADPTRYNTGLSYEEQFKQQGFKTKVLKVTPEKARDIKIARQFIKMIWISKRKCGRLIECLRAYHRAWDAKKKKFNDEPAHDWASHGADSFMAGSVAHKMGLLMQDTDIDFSDDGGDYAPGMDDRSSISGY